MNIQSVNKFPGRKTVTFTHCHNFGDVALVREAFRAAGERTGNFDNPAANVGGFGSSYGYRITRGENTAIVTIHTD